MNRREIPTRDIRRYKEYQKTFAGKHHHARTGEVLEDTIEFTCEFCGKDYSESKSYSSFSKISLFPTIENYIGIKCPRCGSVAKNFTVSREFTKSKKKQIYYMKENIVLQK